MRRTATPEAATARERGHEALDDDRREPERELVDEQDLGTRHERLREHHHLLLAAGQGAAQNVPPLLQLGKELERILGAALGVLLAERIRGDPQVVGDRQLVEKPPAFGHDGHAGAPNPLRPPAREIVVAEQHAAGRRSQDTGHGQDEASTCRRRSARAGP